ncbi:Uncharacterised protein [Pseudomonas luteola]|uniref:Uncharacterized protein n=1 Tax=Pseudomonas luteola TaxID=47886 RepID=A0A2X2EHZ4_PSELU|nr:Uncharacterised protein [Pseudomonas luteola]
MPTIPARLNTSYVIIEKNVMNRFSYKRKAYQGKADILMERLG